MNKISRRSLSRYAVSQIVEGQKSEVLAKNIASVLLADSSSKNIELLIHDILYELEVSGYLSVAKLTTARELNTELKNLITKTVKENVGTSRVELETHLDPGLVGGYLLETATRTWDTSIKKRILQLKEAF